MLDVTIPILDFPELRRLSGFKRTFKVLLYRGGAKLHVKDIEAKIASGCLQSVIPDRIPLVLALHDKLEGDLAAGGSAETAKGRIYFIRKFFEYIDETPLEITLETAIECLISWGTHLSDTVRRGRNNYTAYTMAVQVTAVFSEIINLPSLELLRLMGVKRNRPRKQLLGKQTDKQNLSDTLSFGAMLADYSEQLTYEVIFGELPVDIHFSSGKVIEEWSRRPANKIRTVFEAADFVPFRDRGEAQSKSPTPIDYTIRTRAPLVNLRLEAEILIFIAQTGMNLSQALAIRAGKFIFRSHMDGYQTSRQYKGRRLGDVEFEIFSEYRTHFENYLNWRSKVFPNDENGLLFPIIGNRSTHEGATREFNAIIKRCKILGERYFSPQKLRNTRVNWLLRNLEDPNLAAQMSQHSVRLLLTVYERPNYQIAMVEVSRFHAYTSSASAAGPGACSEPLPQTAPNAPDKAPTPDCLSPAGCLFCEHNRDIDSMDHVWSLLSFRYLKSLEISRYQPLSTGSAVPDNAAQKSVELITSKIKWYKLSSDTRSAWVEEVEAKLEEGEYHPKWDGFIKLAEVM